HAQVSFEIASKLLGKAVGPGPLDVRGMRLAQSPRDLLTTTLLDGCANESLAAAEAIEGAHRCENTAMARLLTKIGEDETRHAALAWKTVRWRVQRWPELQPIAVQTLRDATDHPPSGGDHSASHDVGLLSAAERAALAKETMRRVVLPVGLSLLGETASDERQAIA
ncbi:MAG: hypothetical protein ACI9MC_003796, partial [Kiritimatiellia bacterium]